MILENAGFPVIAFSIFWGCLCENARFWQNVKKNPSSWSVFVENLYLGALGAIGMCRGGHVI